MTDEPTSYLGTITLKDYVPDTLTLTSSRGEAVFIITPDGMLNLGPAYKENPDAAAQEFIRIIMEMMPEAFAKRAALKETASFTDDPFNRAVLGLPLEPGQ